MFIYEHTKKAKTLSLLLQFIEGVLKKHLLQFL